MWKKHKEMVEAIRDEAWAKEIQADEYFWLRVMQWFSDNLFPQFITDLIGQVDEIIKIDPNQTNPGILEEATEYMVRFLEAQSASVRIYDPESEQMISYGSYPQREENRKTYIPLLNSIAGEVVRNRKPVLVGDLMNELRYQNKDEIRLKGVNSLMAIPLEIPSFFPGVVDTVGVIQIYFYELDRHFSPLEVQIAELMARRLSHVIARKKILALHNVNNLKETILRNIFTRVGSGQGIKMKDVFNKIIPELTHIIDIESCALFSVSSEDGHVVLEAGYPEERGYHGIGKRFPINSEPVYNVLMHVEDHLGITHHDLITHSHILVNSPQESHLLSDRLKRFIADHNINSILYVPLRVSDEVKYFMTFDALRHRQSYTEEEIEIFLFIGRELMKAQRMERLDDILHDFKNPAIATAGFARRLKQLMKKEPTDEVKEQMNKCLDILLEETTRLQELALSVYGVGKEKIVNLTERLQQRFDINEQAIKEQLKQNVRLERGPFLDPLYVRCYPLHLERVLDNLLNNATTAIPTHGGILCVKSFREENWACAEITNSGRISDEDRRRLVAGDGSGRGLHITYRIMKLLKGKVDVQVKKDTTTFTIRLPLAEEETGAESR